MPQSYSLHVRNLVSRVLHVTNLLFVRGSNVRGEERDAQRMREREKETDTS